MNKRSNVVKKFFYSMHDAESFRGFVSEGLRRAILYALFLSFVIGGVRGYIQASKFNNYIDNTIEYLNQEEYSFTIENNKLDIETSPIKLREKEIFIYVDKDITVNNTSSIDNIIANEDYYLLILQDGIVVKSALDSELDRLEIDYSQLGMDGGINNETIIDMLNINKGVTIIAIVLMYMIREFIFCIVLAIVIALLTIVPSRLLKVDINFRQLVSLSIYTYTLPNVLVLALNIFIPDVAFDIAVIIGNLAYTYLILRVIKTQNEDDIKL